MACITSPASAPLSWMNVNIANTSKFSVPELQAAAEVLGLPTLSGDATVRTRIEQIAEYIGFIE